MSYCNLKAGLKREGFSYSDVSNVLGMTDKNVYLKLNERIPLTVEETKRIRDALFPGASFDYLLVSDGDVATEREQRGHLADLAVEEAIQAVRNA